MERFSSRMKAAMDSPSFLQTAYGFHPPLAPAPPPRRRRRRDPGLLDAETGSEEQGGGKTRKRSGCRGKEGNPPRFPEQEGEDRLSPEPHRPQDPDLLRPLLYAAHHGDEHHQSPDRP